MRLIVAVDKNWAIGREGELLYHIPEDLHHFKALTWGQTILYGRKTMDTFPGGRPLPGRRNLVLTHHPETLPPGAEAVETFSGLEEAFVVGGASVYAQLLPQCTEAYVTKVDADGGGDAFFPDLDASPEWRLAEASESKQYHGLTYRFCRYVRR